MTDPATPDTGRHRRCERPGWAACWRRAHISVGDRFYCDLHAADAWLGRTPEEPRE